MSRQNRSQLVLGILLVVPVQTWVGALSFGRFSSNFLVFFPQFFSGHFNMGQLYREQGETGKAREHYEKARALCEAVGDKPHLQMVMKELEKLNGV